MGQQHVPLKIDDKGNVIAVGSINDDNYDECVICGKKTPYTRSTHIDLRYGYVEGAGQGCYQPQVCNKLIEPIDPPNDHLKHFLVSFHTVKSTPNDQELGAKVREMFYHQFETEQ